MNMPENVNEHRRSFIAGVLAALASPFLPKYKPQWSGQIEYATIAPGGVFYLPRGWHIQGDVERVARQLIEGCEVKPSVVILPPPLERLP